MNDSFLVVMLHSYISTSKSKNRKDTYSFIDCDKKFRNENEAEVTFYVHSANISDWVWKIKINVFHNKGRYDGKCAHKWYSAWLIWYSIVDIMKLFLVIGVSKAKFVKYWWLHRRKFNVSLFEAYNNNHKVPSSLLPSGHTNIYGQSVHYLWY